MDHLREDDPRIAGLVEKEAARIENTLDLIAAENHMPPSIMEVLGSILNTKTIEGYPGKRFHAGCEFVDLREALADPVYALPDDYAGPRGLSWVYRARPLSPEDPWDVTTENALQAQYGN